MKTRQHHHSTVLGLLVAEATTATTSTRTTTVQYSTYFDTSDGAYVKGLGDAQLVLGLLVAEAGSGQREVAALPLLEDLPLPSFLLLELTLNDGFLLGNRECRRDKTQ